MKNYITILFLFVSALFFSCTGNDDSDPIDSDQSSNEETPTPLGLTVGNEFYPLQNGIIENYGSLWGEDCTSITNYNLDITLYQEGISLDADGRISSGTGKGIYFELISNNNQLANGSYADLLSLVNSTYNQNFSSFLEYVEWEPDEDATEDGGCIDLDGYIMSREIYDANAEEEEGYNETFTLTSGSFSFSRGTNGEITIDLTGATADQSGLDVSLHYVGNLTYIDVSEDDKRVGLKRR